MWTQSCRVVVEAEIGEMHLQVQERRGFLGNHQELTDPKEGPRPCALRGSAALPPPDLALPASRTVRDTFLLF